MQIAVPRVTEIAHGQAQLVAGTAHKAQKIRYLVHRHHHVQLVHKLGVGLNCGQKGASGCPNLFF